MLHLSIMMDGTEREDSHPAIENGPSILVEYRDKRILFDTGYGDRFITNAEKMGYNLQDIDAVVLSHSHFNSVSGYNALLERKMAPQEVFVGKHFFEPKYMKNGPVYTNMNSTLNQRMLEKADMAINEVDRYLEITEGLYVIPCSTDTPYSREIPASYFRYDGKEFVKENFEDEIALVAEVEEGLILIAGSCHRGICNALSYIRKSTERPVIAVIGGMEPTLTERERTYLKVSGIRIIGTSKESIISDDDIKVIKLKSGDEFDF